VVKDGAPDAIVASYLSSVLGDDDQQSLAKRSDRDGAGRYRVTALTVSGGESPVMTGQPAIFEVAISEVQPETDDRFLVNLVVRDHMDRILALMSNDLTSDQLPATGAQTRIACRVDKLPLVPGRYSLDVSIWIRGIRQDKVQHALSFDVANGDYFQSGKAIHIGSFHLEQQWQIRN
jgi:lipopolysaccharide transport system ATP-binding protein